MLLWQQSTDMLMSALAPGLSVLTACSHPPLAQTPITLTSPVQAAGFVTVTAPTCSANAVPVNIIQQSQVDAFGSDTQADACLCNSQYSGPKYVVSKRKCF
jgi:hypothetical protein